MTVIVGLLCEDGVVIGTDSSMTFSAGPSFRTIEQSTKKIFVMGDDLIYAGTGQVGLGQRFNAVLTKIKGDFKQRSAIDVGKTISSHMVKDFGETGVQQNSFGALVGFSCATGLQLAEFAIADFQPELKTPEMWFCSMGSGQPITDPFLAFLKRSFFKGLRPKLNEGTFLVSWALAHAIELNTGGIQGPPQIAILQKAGNKCKARILTPEDLDEHKSNIEAAEEHLSGFRAKLAGEILPGQRAPQPQPIPPSPPTPN